MFHDKSRYKDKEQYELKDRRGRIVKVVCVPDLIIKPVMGIHLLKQGQRPDHLAVQYLNDPTGFWRIADANDSMLPESLTEQQEIAIPIKY